MNRRTLLGALAATALGRIDAVRAEAIITRPIPSSGEKLPAVGLGSWITFNVGYDQAARDSCAEVIKNFFEAGGRLIDSSPMYGSSQTVIGHGLNQLAKPAALFSADKVWTSPGSRGPAQIEASRKQWDVPRFDLLQVHNLMAWKEHLPTLFAMKASGQLRYVGITTSEGRRHRDFEQIMRSQPRARSDCGGHARRARPRERLAEMAAPSCPDPMVPGERCDDVGDAITRCRLDASGSGPGHRGGRPLGSLQVMASTGLQSRRLTNHPPSARTGRLQQREPYRLRG